MNGFRPCLITPRLGRRIADGRIVVPIDCMVCGSHPPLYPHRYPAEKELCWVCYWCDYALHYHAESPGQTGAL